MWSCASIDMFNHTKLLGHQLTYLFHFWALWSFRNVGHWWNVSNLLRLGPIFSSWVLQSSSLLVLGSSSRCFGPSSASFTLWFYVGVGFGYCFLVSSECVTNPAPVSPPKLDRQEIPTMCHRLQVMKVYSLQVMSLVALQASDPDTNMVSTLELKILNLVLSEMCLLPILAFTASSVPLSMSWHLPGM